MFFPLRCRKAIMIVCLAVCCVAVACAETTRYRVLSFFFDGVPNPAEKKAAETEARRSSSPVPDKEPADTSLPVAAANRPRMHPPYQESRCGACHNRESGQIRKTPQQGLCRQCHGNIPGELRYAHGPVAVSDCLFCHHHHGGLFPRMLRATVTDTCHRCHDSDDLAEGEHHAGIEGRSCTDCHGPHGGNNRFFLKKKKER